MDRLRRKLKITSWRLQDIENCIDKRTVDPSVEVVGGVANFCDPDTYPSVDVIWDLRSQGIAVAVGLHPKFAARASPSVKERLGELLALPEVAGLGEIGLDHTVPSDEWPMQRDVFAECLSMLERRHVLVLHCRAQCQDSKGDLLASMFYQMHWCVPQDQSIHLHCFDGSSSDYRQWAKHFPNVYMGLTNKVSGEKFGDAERKAVRLVRKERSLVETDAPYFAPKGTKCSTPGCIGITVKEVARIRGEAYEEVLAATLENGRRLYFKET
jgi:TatD DNase family protein